MKKLFSLSLKQKKRITLLLLILAVILLCLAFFLTKNSEAGYEISTFSMGSYVQQTVYGKNREKAAQEAAQAVDALERLISWRVEGSDIQRLNAHAGQDFISIDPATWEILKDSLSVCEKSGGAFDITIAPLSQLWRFDETPHLPKDSLIQSLLSQVDHRVLSLSEDHQAALQKSGFAIDLGAVGKGAACDAMIKVYEEQGVDRAVAAVGGSVGFWGQKPFGAPWKVTVRDPGAAGGMGVLSLHEGFVSTSGSYERTFVDEETGKTYHHLLDPKTGYPAETHLVSVTVISEKGSLSDALATACFVLGMEESAALLKEFRANAVFVTDSKEVYLTEGIEKSFELTSSQYQIKGVLS